MITSFLCSMSLLCSLSLPPEVPIFDMEETLSWLAYCESSENPNAYVANDNGSPSIGLYQFKQATWNWAIQRYKLGTWKPLPYPNQATSSWSRVDDIKNPKDQRIIARAIIADGRGSTTWKSCWKKLNLL